LEQRLLNVWHNIQKRVIDTSVDEWRAVHNSMQAGVLMADILNTFCDIAN